MPLVLLVDDEPRIARALEFALRDSDFEVRSLSNLGDLESILQQARPAAILLDIGVGGEDGLDACRRLKQHAEFRDIPILLLSGQTRAEVKEAGFAAGADDFIAKPFVPTELIARVRAQIARRARA